MEVFHLKISPFFLSFLYLINFLPSLNPLNQYFHILKEILSFPQSSLMFLLISINYFPNKIQKNYYIRDFRSLIIKK